MNENKKTKDKFTYFSSLTLQELENLLKIDFQSPEKNLLTAEDIQMILEIILQKEEALGHTLNFDVKEGLDSFKKNYMPLAEKGITIYDPPKNLFPNSHSGKQHLFCGKNIIAATLVLFIALGAFTTTTNARELFSHVANWTKETFWFVPNEGIEGNTTSVLMQDFNDAFLPMEIPKGLLPTWLPENLSKASEHSYELGSKKFKKVIYEDTSSGIVLGISIAYLDADATTIYEKDSTDVVIYQNNGIDFYIVNNLDTISAIWKFDSFECQISGNSSKKDLLKMIDSIPPT